MRWLSQFPHVSEGTQAWLVFVIYPVLFYPYSWTVVDLGTECLPVGREINIVQGWFGQTSNVKAKFDGDAFQST